MFIVRSGEEQVVGSGKILLTGISKVTLKAVGSDLATLIGELGYENSKEGKPAADMSADGNRRVRIDFWLQNEKNGVWKESFFVEEVDRTNNAKTKSEFVNAVGQFAFGDEEGNPPSYSWYNETGVRKSYRGEVELVEFIRTLANLKTGKDGDVISINWTKLFTEDLSDMKKLQKDLEVTGNALQALLTVRTVVGDNGQNYYQSMYRKVYGRAYENAFIKFQKSLTDPYGAVKDTETYQDSLTLQVFNPSEVKTPVAAVTSTAVASSPWD
jgi:hypothetical protein